MWGKYKCWNLNVSFLSYFKSLRGQKKTLLNLVLTTWALPAMSTIRKEVTVPFNHFFLFLWWPPTHRTIFYNLWNRPNRHSSRPPFILLWPFKNFSTGGTRNAEKVTDANPTDLSNPNRFGCIMVLDFFLLRLVLSRRKESANDCGISSLEEGWNHNFQQRSTWMSADTKHDI